MSRVIPAANDRLSQIVVITMIYQYSDFGLEMAYRGFDLSTGTRRGLFPRFLILWQSALRIEHLNNIRGR